MADSLRGDIYLNASIVNVNYEVPGGGGSQVLFSVPGSSFTTVSCDSTIIAVHNVKLLKYARVKLERVINIEINALINNFY